MREKQGRGTQKGETEADTGRPRCPWVGLLQKTSEVSALRAEIWAEI